MHSFFRNQRGQGQTEYILLIGLVSLVMLTGLIGYREAVKEYICRVIVALGGDPGDCESASAPSPPPLPNPAPAPATPPAPEEPPAPAREAPPAPAPEESPATNEEWTNFFAGNWCGPPGTGWTWNVTAMGQTRVVTRANSFPPTTFNVEAAGTNQFRLTNAANPGDTIVYERLSDNSFRLVSPLGRGYREGVYTRC